MCAATTAGSIREYRRALRSDGRWRRREAAWRSRARAPPATAWGALC